MKTKETVLNMPGGAKAVVDDALWLVFGTRNSAHGSDDMGAVRELGCGK